MQYDIQMNYGKHQLTVLSKANYVRELLARDSIAILCVNGKHPEVELPELYRQRAKVTLSFATGGANPIKNMKIGDSGLTATLAFNPAVVAGEECAFDCYLPWGAVYGILELAGKGLCWAEDVPAEVAPKYNVVSHATDPSGTVDLPVIMSDETTTPDA